VATEYAQRSLAVLGGLGELLRDAVDRSLRRGKETPDFRIARRLGAQLAPRFELTQAMAERADQRLATAGIAEQVVLQIGIALDDPDVAKHFEEHSRRAPGATFAAQILQQRPHRLAQQANDDLAIGERRVVVWNLAQTRGGDFDLGERRVGKRVHRLADFTATQQTAARAAGLAYCRALRTLSGALSKLLRKGLMSMPPRRRNRA